MHIIFRPIISEYFNIFIDNVSLHSNMHVIYRPIIHEYFNIFIDNAKFLYTNTSIVASCLVPSLGLLVGATRSYLHDE